MKIPPSMVPVITGLAFWDRRVAAWRDKAQLMLMQAELGERLALGDGTRVERGVIWRVGGTGRVRLGAASTIRTGAELKVDGKLTIGKRVLIGAWTTLSVFDEVVIGDDCLLAERVSIRDHDHRFEHPDVPVADQGYRVSSIRLGNNVWLGAGVTLLKGVSLGDGCVVGANAVVTRSFPAGCVLAGVPARVIQQLPIDERSYACTD